MWIKKIFFIFLLSLCLFSCQGICSAGQVYTIQETKLQKLDENLIKLSYNNQESQRKYQIALTQIKSLESLVNKQAIQIKESQNQIEIYKKKLQESEKQLNLLQKESLNQINSLATANQYLDRYVKQEIKKKSKLKTQRNILLVCVTTLAIERVIRDRL